MVTNLLLVSFNLFKNERLRKSVKYFSLIEGYAIIKKLKILRRMIMYSKNKKIKYSIRKTALATVSLAVGLVMMPVVGAEKMAYAEEDIVEATPAEEEIEKNTGEIIDDAGLPEGAGEPDLAVDGIATKTTPANPVLTEVEDATSITQDEKDRVAIEIGKANPDLPEGTSVTVGIDGEVTFTYADGSTNTISGEYTVVERTIARHTTPIKPELTEVGDVTNITQDEKDKIAIEIGKVNSDLPEGTSVTIGNDGEVTFTYADGSTNKIPGKYTVGLKGQTQPVQLEQPKAKEEAKRLPNTGIVTNNAVVAGLSILAVATLLAARRKNNK